MSSPMTAPASYPKVRSAAGLKSRMRPRWSMAITASSAAASMARLRRSPMCAASSARRRSIASPIWSPSPVSVRRSSTSGSRGAVSNSSTTATTPRTLRAGKHRAVRRPTVLATRARGKFGSRVTSTIQSGWPVSHTRPGRPSPGASASEQVTPSNGS